MWRCNNCGEIYDTLEECERCECTQDEDAKGGHQTDWAGEENLLVGA